MNENIVLCGFMGSGKTSVGTLLAERLQMQFVDMDQLIEEKCKMSVTQIFAQFGEAEFRKAETEVCKELGQKYGLVIATGGGAVTFSQNVSYLKQNGIVVFLNVTVDTVLERLKNDTTRPLLQGDKEKNVSELLQKRLPIYRSAADYTIAADQPMQQVAEAIIKVLNK